MAEPIRTCIGCGAREPQHQLVRLRLAGGRVEVDRSRSGGRGAWVHAARACVERAEKRRAYGRVFRQAGVSSAPELLRDVLTGSTRKD